MANLSHIDMSNVEIGPDAGSGYDLLPEGKYLAKVIDSKLVPTKGMYQPVDANGNAQGEPVPKGYLLELTWQIQSGPHERRLIWDKITLIHHTSDDAQRIGRETWRKAVRAAGLGAAPQDSSEIHQRPVLILVKTKPASNGYEAANAIKSYYPAPAQQCVINQPMQANAPIAGEPQAAPPWGGKTAQGDVPF